MILAKQHFLLIYFEEPVSSARDRFLMRRPMKIPTLLGFRSPFPVIHGMWKLSQKNFTIVPPYQTDIRPHRLALRVWTNLANTSPAGGVIISRQIHTATGDVIESKIVNAIEIRRKLVARPLTTTRRKRERSPQQCR
jgi:hypothetical protein